MRWMSSKLTDVCRDLQLTESDMREIREMEERARLRIIVAGAVVVAGSFVAGYLISGYASSESYPFSAATAGPIIAAGSWKRRWQLGIVLALLAFLSFFLGAALRDPPSFGAGTYYEAYSRKT